VIFLDDDLVGYLGSEIFNREKSKTELQLNERECNLLKLRGSVFLRHGGVKVPYRVVLVFFLIKIVEYNI